MKKLRNFLHMKGKSYLFCAILMAEALPLLLQAGCFFYRSDVLSPALVGSITLFTFCCSWLFLNLALMRNTGRPITFETVFSTAARTLLACGPSLFLELTLFRRLFRTDNPLLLVLALLMAALAVHTCQWIVELTAAKEGTLFPHVGSWRKVWISYFRHPLLTLGQLLFGLLLLLCSDVLFPLLQERVFAGLSDTLPGALGVYLLFSFLLFPAAVPLLRLSTLSLMMEGAVTEVAEEDAAAEPDPKTPQRRQAGAAEEILIEAGLMTAEELQVQPVAIITDKEISAKESSASVYKDHFSFFHSKKRVSAESEEATFRPDLISLALVLALVGFLVLDNRQSVNTPEKMVNDLLASAETKMEAKTEAGLLNAAANVCQDTLVQLSALDAYLAAPETAESPEDIARLFAPTRRLEADSYLTDLLQARLLLKFGFAEQAVSLLETALEQGMHNSDLYLTLLQAYKAAGPAYETQFRLARSICLSHQVFTDDFAHLDDLTPEEIQTLRTFIATSSDSLYLNQQLLLWQAFKERGDYEAAYNGLYALLSSGSTSDSVGGSFYSQSTKHWKNLQVLRAFVETGMEYHIRTDGTDKKIAEYYNATVQAALTYDDLFTVARAAGEYTGNYTLEDVKSFVGEALLSCQRYDEAFQYLSEAWVLFPTNRDLQLLYARAALACGHSDKALSAASGVANLASESFALDNVVLPKNVTQEEAHRLASALSIAAVASLDQGEDSLRTASFYASALAQLLLEDSFPSSQEIWLFRFAREFTARYVLDPSIVSGWQNRTLIDTNQREAFLESDFLYNYLMAVQLWSSSQYSSALHYADLALEKGDDLALLSWLKGDLLLQGHREAGTASDSAMLWFVKSLTLQPDNGRAWYGLAECRRDLGLSVSAEAAYRQVLRTASKLDYTPKLYKDTNYQLLQKVHASLRKLGQ